MPETVESLLCTTRAVRRRLDLARAVPRTLIEDCLRVAQQAPNGSGRHLTHWIVVTEPAIRVRLGEIYREAFIDGLAGIPTGPATSRSLLSASWLAERLSQVPVLVVPCVAVPDGLPGGNQAALWGSVLPGVWSYMLAARARGLGTVWTTAHLRREAETAALLGIQDAVVQAALIPTAWYRGARFRPAARPPLETVLHHDRWLMAAPQPAAGQDDATP